MDQEPFDRLTRAFGAPISRRQMLRAVTNTTVASLAGWLGREAFTSGTVHAAGTCPPVDQYGECPPGDTKVPIPGHVPTSNGCGPEGGILPIILPQHFGAALFYPSCNGHDICYENCAVSKDTCDLTFYNGLVQSCISAYSGITSILHRGWCSDLASAYYHAVSQGGNSAWVSAQQKACECFPSQVYCNCNHKCYPTAQVLTCLDECKTGLGCFSGICGPATTDTCPC